MSFRLGPLGMGWSLALLAAAGLAGAGCATSRAGRWRNEAAYGAYLRGLMLERTARFPEALDAYRLALDQDRRSPLLHVRLGATHLKLGQTERALQAFNRALALAPDQPDALRWVAMLHASKGELEEAVAAYERILAAEPNDQFVLSTLADLYVLQGELPHAVDAYHRLIKEFGSTSQLHFNLGVLYGRMNRLEDALEELSRAFELAPDALDTRVALGLTYELHGRFEQAAAWYEDAVRMDPLNPRLYHHAARAHLNAKQFAEAAASYQTVLDLAPSDLDAVMGLVRVWLAQHRYDDAARFLARQLDALGEPPELYVALGIVYREAKQAQEAMRAFERAIARNETYAQAHFYLAAQLDQLDRKDEARESLRRTLALDPNHPDALNYLGYLDAEAGRDLGEAKTLIERALAMDPENGAYLDSLGWVYFKMDRLEEAIRYLERAAELLDSDPIIFDHLGEAHFKRREFEQARRNWERALELDQTQTGIQEKLQRIMSLEESAPAR